MGLQAKPVDADITVLSDFYNSYNNYRINKANHQIGSRHSYSIRKILAVRTTKCKSEDNKIEVKKSELEILSTENITCINIVKSWFGKGKLAHLEYSLKTVHGYLQEFDWTEVKTNTQPVQQTAFKTVCAIANRWAKYSFRYASIFKTNESNDGLMKLLSDVHEIKGVKFYINNETQVCDLAHQVCLQANVKALESAKITELNFLGFHKEAHTFEEKDKEIRTSITKINVYLHDHDNRKGNPSLTPLSRIVLNDGTYKGPYHHVSDCLSTIDKIEFVVRLNDDKFATELKEDLNKFVNPDLTTFKCEKYKQLDNAEDEIILLKAAGLMPNT